MPRAFQRTDSSIGAFFRSRRELSNGVRMIEIGEIRFLRSLETIIFGPPWPWRLVHWILEGRFLGVPKTLIRFEAKSFQT